MFTGAGSFATVSDLSRPGRRKTFPLPAPLAFRFGAAKGMKAAEAELVKTQQQSATTYADGRWVARTQCAGDDAGEVELRDLARGHINVLVSGLLRDEGEYVAHGAIG